MLSERVDGDLSEMAPVGSCPTATRELGAELCSALAPPMPTASSTGIKLQRPLREPGRGSLSRDSGERALLATRMRRSRTPHPDQTGRSSAPAYREPSSGGGGCGRHPMSTRSPSPLYESGGLQPVIADARGTARVGERSRVGYERPELPRNRGDGRRCCSPIRGPPGPACASPCWRCAVRSIPSEGPEPVAGRLTAPSRKGSQPVRRSLLAPHVAPRRARRPPG